jgi:hypothetical protein
MNSKITLLVMLSFLGFCAAVPEQSKPADTKATDISTNVSQTAVTSLSSMGTGTVNNTIPASPVYTFNGTLSGTAVLTFNNQSTCIVGSVYNCTIDIVYTNYSVVKGYTINGSMQLILTGTTTALSFTMTGNVVVSGTYNSTVVLSITYNAANKTATGAITVDGKNYTL